jgi:drug/metabolite transporter superfamily protein YnfA
MNFWYVSSALHSHTDIITSSIFPSGPRLLTYSMYDIPLMQETSFHTHKAEGKIIIFCILIFNSLVKTRKNKILDWVGAIVTICCYEFLFRLFTCLLFS